MHTVTPVRPGTGTPTADPRAQQLRAVDDVSAVQAIVHSTVQAAMEVLAGTRPLQQLSRRLDHKCLTALQHRVALIRHEAARSASPHSGRLHRNAAVRSVRVCAVAEGVYEGSAVVVEELRVRAVAVRLERSREVWHVTELVIG